MTSRLEDVFFWGLGVIAVVGAVIALIVITKPPSSLDERKESCDFYCSTVKSSQGYRFTIGADKASYSCSCSILAASASSSVRPHGREE